MKTHTRSLQIVLILGLSVALLGCSDAEPAALPSITTLPTTTTTTVPDSAECDFQVGPAVIKGEVSQTSGGIGGWLWHSVRPLGCAESFSVVNLSSDEVAVTYEQCFDDCIADGISTSIDTFQMELHGQFVMRADLPTENVAGDEELVFVADGVAHMPDANRQMVSDVVDTRWIFTTQVTRTADGFVVGNTGAGLSLELTADQAAEFVDLVEGEATEVLRLYGATTGKGSVVVESVEYF